jgi:hypothetical protein
MPKDGDSTKIPDSRSLTILLGNNNNASYYNGDMTTAIKNNQVFQTSYDEINGLGSIIRQKQVWLEKRKLSKKELIVLIKPGRECSYKNVINALDEMLINGVSRYVITDLENNETVLLDQSNHNH